MPLTNLVKKDTKFDWSDATKFFFLFEIEINFRDCSFINSIR